MLSDEANHRDRQAREALFLTFSSDLGFFESQVLATARSTGAAVTVVADAKVYEPDPRAIRAAGVRYGIGLVSMTSVFHPKVTVVAGADRAAVGIGSGNLTIGGWHLNDEVLAVVTGDAESGCPPVLHQAADWLAELVDTDSVRLGRTARAGIGRTANELRMLCASAPATTDDLRLLGNLRASILSQLPHDPVDELRLFAPFHDLAGQALDELITTLQPSAVTIAIQDKSTVIDPHVLLAVANRYGIQVRFERAEEKESDSSYRHGKLIEARRDGAPTWTLAGSPNLSPQALCRSVAAGGNCELAVLDRPGHDLYPPTTAVIPRNELKAVRTGPPSAEEEPIVCLVRDWLLEACIDGEVLTLTFAKLMANAFSVEVSDYQTDPDQFRTIAEFEPGGDEYSVEADSDWYYPLRLRILLNGEAGPIHFVMRPDQVVARSSGGGGVRVPDYDPEQIFADDRQAREWLSAVTELTLHSQSARRGPRIAGAPSDARAGGTGHALRWDDPATWHAYVDDAMHRLGESMVGFALGGLPRLSFLSSRGRAAWEDDFATRGEDVAEDDINPAPDDGLQDEDDDESSEDSTPRDFGSAERQRFRRWLGDLVGPMDKLDAIDRGARARLTLRATRMKLWEPHTESEWFELLLKATSALPGADIPPQYKPQLSALAQVMLQELASAARAIGLSRTVDGRSAMAAYLEVEGRLRDLLTPVDQALIEVFANTIRVKGTVPPDPDLIAQHASGALDTDPVVQALRHLMLSYPELMAGQESDTVLTVQTSEPSPLLAGGRCLDAVRGDWAVFAISRLNRRAFVARVGSTMLTAELTQNQRAELAEDRVRFRSFRLTPFVSATRIAAREGVVLDGDIRAIETPPLDSPGVKGSEVLTVVGVEPAKVRRFIKHL